MSSLPIVSGLKQPMYVQMVSVDEPLPLAVVGPSQNPDGRSRFFVICDRERNLPAAGKELPHGLRLACPTEIRARYRDLRIGRDESVAAIFEITRDQRFAPVRGRTSARVFAQGTRIVVTDSEIGLEAPNRVRLSTHRTTYACTEPGCSGSGEFDSRGVFHFIV